MRDAPLIRIVTVLLVGAVCAVGCSRDKRDVRPLPAHDAAVQGSAAVVGLPVDAGRPPDLIPVGEASSWNRNSELVRRKIRPCSLQVRACYDAELIDNPVSVAPGFAIRRSVASVMTPSVPSEPTKSCVRS